ncbi:MAG: hypothetical protein J3Q66DRAFT_336962 [Benniella sp.]|nr:MAG: hypothetical protein J3Q66DRAFT_336962 [Benniella sp.]
MAFCRSCIVSFSRSASLRSPFAPLATSVRPRPCAAPATPSLLSGTQQPSARALLHTGMQGRSQVLLARQYPLVSSLSRERRLNSNAAATATLDASSPTTSLKVHNPQFDESGKELVIDITDKAVKQLKHMAVRDQSPLQALRVTVDSGGCHGYQYLMDLTDIVNEDDVIFEKDGARVVIDTITLPMMSGSKIDYLEELIGSAFKVVNNPHAAHSCGCDTSFEIKI